MPQALLKYNPPIDNPDDFQASHFDDWAATYDQDVALKDPFPFAGYRQVLDTIVRLAKPTRGMRILDVGTGTGNLGQLFAGKGCRLWCTDFSAQMLEHARQKLPGASLLQADLRAGWPADLPDKFDRIVSSYVFHHFSLDQKVNLVRELVNAHLAADGKLIIGDLSFDDGVAELSFAQSVGALWEEEPYWVANESLAALRADGIDAEYVRVSNCAGVYCIEGGDGVRTQD